MTTSHVTKKYWGFRITAISCALLLLVIIEFGLRVFGVIPPDDPLVFHVKSFVKNFSPFVEASDGTLTIKPDWVKQNEVYRVKDGTRAGRVFVYPGFRPVRFTRTKAPNTIRIFALGGSTTFGQWVGAEYAFPVLIGRHLQERMNNRQIEVLNLGCPGLESTRVAILFERILEFDPDVILIYAGHNEMLMEEKLLVPTLEFADKIRITLISVSHIAGWMNYGISRYRRLRDYEIMREESAELEAGKIVAHVNVAQDGWYRLPSKAYLDKVAENYFNNMHTIAVTARKAGIPTFFILPVANPLFPPEQSGHADNFQLAEQFSALLRHFRNAFQNNDYQEALEYVDRAIALSPDYAMAHYARGTVLLSVGQQAEALTEFQRAADLDAYTHRITSRLQTTMIDAVESAKGTWIDPRPIFQRELSTPAIEKLFIDHCHPTKYGHQLIADMVFPLIIEHIER